MEIKIHFMGKYKSTYCTKTIERTDCQTGEIYSIEIEKQNRITIDQDQFYMVYIDFMSPFFNLKSDVAKSILSWLCCNAEYNTGKVVLHPSAREQMMKDLNISSKASISQYLKMLVDKKIMSGSRSVYFINPQMFWKGDNLTRERLLKTKEFEITFRIPDTDSGVF